MIILDIILFFISLFSFVKFKDKRKNNFFFGSVGEKRVSKKLKELNLEHIDNLYIPYIPKNYDTKITTTQIDHILPSNNCFVILETKNWIGHVIGDTSDSKWKIRTRSGKIEWRHNPLTQVWRQSRALTDYTKIETKGFVVVPQKLTFDKIPPKVLIEEELPFHMAEMIKSNNAVIKMAWSNLKNKKQDRETQIKLEKKHDKDIQKKYIKKYWILWTALFILSCFVTVLTFHS